MAIQPSYRPAQRRPVTASILVLLPYVPREDVQSLIDDVHNSYPTGEVFLVDSERNTMTARVSESKRSEPLPRPARFAGDGYAELTPRENEVLRLIARGATNKAIAAELSISHNTVRAHARSLIQKLRVSNRIQAAALAAQAGLSSIGGLHGDFDRR